MAGVAGVEVADGEGGVERLLHVAVLESALLGGAVGPRAGVAVGLELERHRRQLPTVLLEEAELVLDLVTVLVRHDVRDREVADRAAVALRAPRERLVEGAVVDVGGELLRDVERVVTRAVGGGAVAQGAVRVAAGARRGLAGRDPPVAHLRLRQAGGLERLGPVGVDVLRDGGQELLHVLRLGAVARAEDQAVRPGAGRRPRVRGGGRRPRRGGASRAGRRRSRR